METCHRGCFSEDEVTAELYFQYSEEHIFFELIFSEIFCKN